MCTVYIFFGILGKINCGAIWGGGGQGVSSGLWVCINVLFWLSNNGFVGSYPIDFKS